MGKPAEIFDWSDAEGSAVFRRFWMGRRILGADAQSRRPRRRSASRLRTRRPGRESAGPRRRPRRSCLRGGRQARA